MEKTRYRQMLNQRLLEIGKQLLEEWDTEKNQETSIAKIIERIVQIEQEAMKAGVFLPYQDGCAFLELSDFEKVLVCILWYQKSVIGQGLALQKMKMFQETDSDLEIATMLSPCFHFDFEFVFLSPTFFSYLQGEIPVLPEGMELVFPEQSVFFGEEDIKDVGFRVLEEEFEFPVALLVSGNIGSGRHYFIEQLCAKVERPVLFVEEPQKGYVKRAINELVLCSGFYDAFVCVEINQPKTENLLKQLASYMPKIGMIKEKEVYINQETGFSHVTIDIALPGKQIKMQMIQSCFEEIEQPVPLPSAIFKQQLAAKQLPIGQFLRYICDIRAEILAGNLNLEEVINRSGTLHLNLLASTRTFEELKLPETQYKQLLGICNMVAAREQVMASWGFGKKFSYGNGMSILFYGAPGTGKTMTAQVMANKLGMPLYRVDLSQLISKYIGETQKNIGRIFDEADKCDCILLFDEADAIFAKRSDVSDAQDRYSNAETAYLLQRIEQYAGVSILATNLLQNFDDAFRRRISYMVHFPLPDMKLRKELWESIFPKEAEIADDVDFLALAQAFELSGAAIKNAAMHSAYVAMARNSKIHMAHILDGVQNEYGKMGKSFGSSQKELFNGYPFFEE